MEEMTLSWWVPSKGRERTWSVRSSSTRLKTLISAWEMRLRCLPRHFHSEPRSFIMGLIRPIALRRALQPMQAQNLCRRCLQTTTRGDRPLRLAVIGAGPAGFYTAYRVLSKLHNAKVDMYESLPVPYGLVRFGVAPDHPEVKV